MQISLFFGGWASCRNRDFLAAFRTRPSARAGLNELCHATSLPCPHFHSGDENFKLHRYYVRYQTDKYAAHGLDSSSSPILMAALSNERDGFYRKPDNPTESICMSCFATVRVSKPERLRDAENIHRADCPNNPPIYHRPSPS
jgi:hypothetical protein